MCPLWIGKYYFVWYNIRLFLIAGLKMSKRLDIFVWFSHFVQTSGQNSWRGPDTFSCGRLCTVLTEVYDGAPEPSLVRENEEMIDRRIL